MGNFYDKRYQDLSLRFHITMSANVPISFACGPYDRMTALERGQVKPAGIALNYITIDHPRDVFDRMIGNHEFDASELSTSEYICRYAAGHRDLVAIPVFPSRAFRHSFIAVNQNIIKKPEDLNGKKVGVQLYTMTAAVWIRGLLQHSGVDLSSITWVEGAVEKPGSHGVPSAEPLLKPVTRVRNETNKSLSQLLEDGEIAATIGTRFLNPSCHYGRKLTNSRLFFKALICLHAFIRLRTSNASILTSNPRKRHTSAKKVFSLSCT